MRRTALSLAALAFVAGTLAWSQPQTASVGRVYGMTPKPGMVKQFEEGRKRHMDWHRKQNDTWTWDTWVVETGPNTGNYISTTLDHSFKDFDTWEAKLGAGDTADSETNVAPYLGFNDNSFWMLRADISRMPTGNPTAKMLEVNHYLLKPDGGPQFGAAAKKIHEAIVKSNWPVNYAWYSLVDGGEGPHWVLLIYMNGWADLAEPEPSFDTMLKNAVGPEEFANLMQGITKSIKRQWTEVIRHRPDLSYKPAAK